MRLAAQLGGRQIVPVLDLVVSKSNDSLNARMEAALAQGKIDSVSSSGGILRFDLTFEQAAGPTTPAAKNLSEPGLRVARQQPTKRGDVAIR